MEIKTNSNRAIRAINVVDITPEMAAQLLSKNINNRNLRPDVLKRYILDMMTGNWSMNGEPIKINDKGELVDGQHRLTACLKSGITLRQTVIITVDSGSATNYDVGATRSIRDLAHFENLEGVVYRDTCVHSAFSIALELAKPCEGFKPSKAYKLEQICMYEEAARFLYDNYISGSKKLKGLRRASVLATILNAYINGVDKDKLIRFCKVMCTGIAMNAEEDNYIIRFRNHILESKYNGGNTPIKELYFITQTVLHNYLIGRYKKRITNDNKAYYVFPIDTNTINEEKLSHLTLMGKKSK